MASSRIEQDLVSIDCLPKVRILDSRRNDKVNRLAQKRLEPFEQTKETVRVTHFGWLFKLHQEVKVTLTRAKGASSRGSKDFKASHSELPAESCDSA